MTSSLVGWVNDVLQLEPPMSEATLAEDLSSGFVLGALLHKHNQLPAYRQLRRRDTSDAKIGNFCLLEPVMASLGVRFDAPVAHGVMSGDGGVGALVLYQVKVALDKLLKFSTPVSVRESSEGVVPLPNFPQRTRKPQFDLARSKQFEAAIRTFAEPPNTRLMREHLRRFDDDFERGQAREQQRAREAEAERVRQRDANREARLTQRQQEIAFVESWEARGEDQWVQNRTVAFSRERRGRDFVERTQRALLTKRDASKTKAAQVTSDELGKFDEKLATRSALQISNDDQRWEDDAAGGVAKTVPLSAGMLAESTDDMALDATSLRRSRDAQDEARRRAVAERLVRAKSREMRRRRFITEREGAQVVEYDERAASHLQAQLTRPCLEERRMDDRLRSVALHKDRMAESRAYRASQYAARRDVDADLALAFDEAALTHETADYVRDLADHASERAHVAEARAAAASCASTEFCRALVDRVASVAMELAALRALDAPKPTHQGQTFFSAPDEASLDRPWHDAKRVFVADGEAVLLGAVVAQQDAPAQGDQEEEAAFSSPSPGGGGGGGSVVAWAGLLTLACVPGVPRQGPPSGPPQWPTTDKEEDAGSEPLPVFSRVADCLDDGDLGEYLANAAPFWFNERVADAEVSWGLETPRDFAAACEAALDQQKSIAESPSATSLGSFAAGAGTMLDPAAQVVAHADYVDRKDNHPNGLVLCVDHLLGEAIVDARLAAREAPAADQKEAAQQMFVRLPPRFQLCVALGGPTFAGKSEQAARLAVRYDLKVISVDALVDEALTLHDEVAMGRRGSATTTTTTTTQPENQNEKVTVVAAAAAATETVETAEGLLRQLGRELSQELRGGGAVGDDTYARLVVAEILRLEEQNAAGGLLVSSSSSPPPPMSDGGAVVTRWQGWVLDDFPQTASQCAALERRLTGYDASQDPWSRWDLASRLARPATKPYQRWPGSSIRSADGEEVVASGLDLFIMLDASAEVATRRCLGRRVDPETKEEYHLDSKKPQADSLCAARLVPMVDPSNPSPCLPLQLAFHEDEGAHLRAFLERFGTLREDLEIINTHHQQTTHEAVFAAVAPLVDTLVDRRVDAEKAAKRELEDFKARALGLYVGELRADCALKGLTVDAQRACVAAKVAEADMLAAAEPGHNNSVAPPAVSKKPPVTKKNKKKKAANNKAAGSKGDVFLVGNGEGASIATEEEEEEEEEGPAEVAVVWGAELEALEEAVAEASRVALEGQGGSVALEVLEAVAARHEPPPPQEEEEKEEEAASAVIPRALARQVARAWDAFETRFVAGVRTSCRALREDRALARADLHTLRLDFARFLARPDRRQHVLAAFVRDRFNSMPVDARADEETKAELHLRCEELRAALWRAVEEREADAVALVDSYRADGALERRQLALSRNLAALAQLEVDRTHAAIMLLHDVHDARAPDCAGALKRCVLVRNHTNQPSPDADAGSSSKAKKKGASTNKGNRRASKDSSREDLLLSASASVASFPGNDDRPASAEDLAASFGPVEAPDGRTPLAPEILLLDDKAAAEYLANQQVQLEQQAQAAAKDSKKNAAKGGDKKGDKKATKAAKAPVVADEASSKAAKNPLWPTLQQGFAFAERWAYRPAAAPPPGGAAEGDNNSNNSNNKNHPPAACLKGGGGFLREAVGHQAILLQARLERLRACGADLMRHVSDRHEKTLEDLAAWTRLRVDAELAVNEEVIRRAQLLIEAGRPMETSWTILGIHLDVTSANRLVPLDACAEWTAHPRAHRLLRHAHLRQALPAPPPPPASPHLDAKRFSAAQKDRLLGALRSAASSSSSSKPSLRPVSSCGRAHAADVLGRLALLPTALPDEWKKLDFDRFTAALDPSNTGTLSLAALEAALPVLQEA